MHLTGFRHRGSMFAVSDDNEDDLQVALSQPSPPVITAAISSSPNRASFFSRKPPELSVNLLRVPERPKTFINSCNDLQLDGEDGLDSLDPSIDFVGDEKDNDECSGQNQEMLCNSCGKKDSLEMHKDENFEDFEESSELDVLIKLCDEHTTEENMVDGENEGCSISCPMCGIDLSEVSEGSRLVHTNDCIDKGTNHDEDVKVSINLEHLLQPQGLDDSFSLPRNIDASAVIEFLRSLGLERYEQFFIREEIDWDTLQCMTEEDLISVGVAALGPRKKIVRALIDLKEGHHLPAHIEKLSARHASGTNSTKKQVEASETEICQPIVNKLITDYFHGSSATNKAISRVHQTTQKRKLDSSSKAAWKRPIRSGKLRDVPSWCNIPGTSFRVDSFKYLKGDCCHWFLSHFHMDHYQGLTRSFCNGKIYCSYITAKLVNMKIGIPWDKICALPLNQKIVIADVSVTCVDANHCPGSIIILFEPPNGKAVLHTGDFRFCEMMANSATLRTCSIHTLILDTTYCDPQYDFPKQEAVIQFVIEAIQAEAFNPTTLFLIGSYTIGKERLFLEVARVLQTKVHVTPAKFRLLDCLGFSEEDIHWFTLNEQESNIHVVPMWSLASFKRLKQVSNRYLDRFSLVVAFSPTGWSFGKGKRKSNGQRLQKGTIIRYEVPYSEHCSFTELREFVKFISPEKIIPSVNNAGPDSARSMLSLLRPSS